MRTIADTGLRISERGNAIDKARLLYAKHGLDFMADLWEHLNTGYVIALPNCFAMATAIKSDGREIDTWFVKVAIGDLRTLVRLIPVPLPFIAFCRGETDKRLRIYRMDRIKTLSGIRNPVSEITS